MGNHSISTLILVYVSLALACGGAPASPCREFSLGLCDPNMAELVDSIPLPDFSGSVSTCQYLCQNQENCGTFRYDRASGRCDLYHYRYSASCQMVGGTSLPSADDCLHFWEQDPNNCDGFVDEDCTYLSTVVLERDTITDYHSCQAFLVGLVDILGVNYFTYNSQLHVCQLYSGWERNCSVSMGPKFPSLDDCQTTTTSPPISSSSAAPGGCESPPSSPSNGEWICERGSDGYLDVCYLQCSDGYASSDTLVHCIGANVWEAGADEALCDPLAVMLIGGGINSLTYDSVELYSPSRDCNKVLPNLINGRSYSVGQSLDDGIVLVCGGTGKEDMLSDCEFLNLNDSSIWSSHSLMNEDRMGADGTAVKNTFFMLGGFDSSGAEHIDTDEGIGATWKYGPNLPGLTRSIFGHCVVPWDSDSLLSIGGTYSRTSIYTSDEVFQYNSTTGKWTEWPSLTIKRRNHACVRFGENILVGGGDSGDVDDPANLSTELYNPTTGVFTRTGDLNIPRLGAKMMVVEGGRVLVMGGYNPVTKEFLDSVEEFSMESQTWILLEKKLNQPRGTYAMASVPASFC